MKKCKICRQKFTPKYSTLQPTCNEPKCMAEFGRANAKKFEKKEMQERREKSLTLSDYIQLCQKVFNTYIRLRDKNLPCISCGTRANVQMAAGHFYHAGGHPNLRFDEDNVHKQCNQKCNMRLSGNLLKYRERLIKRIGIDRFTALESRKNETRKYTIPEIKEMIALYREKIKQISK